MLGPVGVVAAVVGLTGASIYSGERARSEQRRASRAQQRINERQNQQERVGQVRQAQIQRAQIAASAGAQGTQNASTTQGAQAAVQSTAAANIQFLNQVEGLQQEIQRRQESASRFAGLSQATGQLSNLAASFVK